MPPCSYWFLSAIYVSQLRSISLLKKSGWISETSITERHLDSNILTSRLTSSACRIVIDVVKIMALQNRMLFCHILYLRHWYVESVRPRYKSLSRDICDTRIGIYLKVNRGIFVSHGCYYELSIQNLWYLLRQYDLAKQGYIK